jgi:hypothetical protein
MGQGAGTRNEVLQLAAGVADLVAEGLRDVARRVPGLGEIREELRVRGELALKRTAPVPEAHTEVLSRQVVRRASGE